LFTEINGLPDRVVEYLDGLEMPIRLLNGAGQAMRPPGTWRGQARAAGAQIAECEREGITLVSYGMDRLAGSGFGSYAYHEHIPAPFSPDGVFAPREWLVPEVQTEDDIRNPTTGRTMAKVVGRTVYYALPIDGTLPWDDIDLDQFLGEPIRRIAYREQYAEARREEAERLAAERRQREVEEARDAFVQAVRGRHRNRVPQLERERTDTERNIQSYLQSISVWQGQLLSLTEEIRALENYDPGVE
jgi:hypothetical protein